MEKRTLKDLARLVEEKERELAYGSETALLGQFVDQFDTTGSILDSDDNPDATEDYYVWERAYEIYARKIDSGEEFDLDDVWNEAMDTTREGGE